MTEQRFLSVPEVAQYLGLSKSAVRSLIRTGELRAVNLAREGARRPRWAVDKRELQKFVARKQAGPHLSVEARIATRLFS